jgi:NAD(P)H dehydrogenase (quinone)
MKVFVLLAHPKPGSFNHAIADTVAATVRAHGGTCILHDLCAEDFDPLFPPAELTKDGPFAPVVIEHGRELVESDGLVIVHPNWWGQPPAILKGWVDRVLRMGVAYKFGINDNGEGVPIGLLRGKWALVFNTSNTPPAREAAVFGDPLENLWRTCVLAFCGIERVQRTTFSVVITSTPGQRAGWLRQVQAATEEMLGGA